ncbi:MAG: hypothetical protein M1370_10230 [Bacteroidetes bacterium]|nr:hypothetical protein [Bacteroidota bacterium]MCL5026884.1 hypothetical protein [Chloroflexota bacterium]
MKITQQKKPPTGHIAGYLAHYDTGNPSPQEHMEPARANTKKPYDGQRVNTTEDQNQ